MTRIGLNMRLSKNLHWVIKAILRDHGKLQEDIGFQQGIRGLNRRLSEHTAIHRMFQLVKSQCQTNIKQHFLSVIPKMAAKIQ